MSDLPDLAEAYNASEYYGRIRQIKEMNLPRAFDQKPTSDKVLILGGGPSLNQPYKDSKHTNIEEINKGDAYLVLAGAAHNLYINGRVRKPDAVVFSVAASAQIEVIKEIIPDCTYYVSSDNDPDFVEFLVQKGADVRVFDPDLRPLKSVSENLDEERVFPGSSAATGAMTLFHRFGVKNFEFCGVDGAVKYSKDLQDVQVFVDTCASRDEVCAQVGERVYPMDGGFYPHMPEFGKVLSYLDDPNLDVHFWGESAYSYAFNHGNRKAVSLVNSASGATPRLENI